MYTKPEPSYATKRNPPNLDNHVVPLRGRGRGMTAAAGQRVVIIGGGYAGTALARTLDGVADVTLVDRKDVFFHRIASLRAAVEPEWTSRPFIAYDKLLVRGRFVRAAATGIDAERSIVTLDSGQALPYDAAVIATGAEARDPARFTGATLPEAVAAMRGQQQRIAQALSILIVGGGPVGVELAGEIRSAHPRKPVKLIQRQDSLLAGAQNPQLSERALRRLQAQDVTVRLGQRVSPSGGESDRGELILWAVGNRPNTAWLADDHPELLTPAGLVRVDAFLRVDGWSNVFAIGDVNDVPVGKLVLPAVAQAKTAAGNVKAALDGSPSLTAHRPSDQKLLIVPIGPRDGVTMLPLSRQGIIAGSWTTRNLKGGNLLLPRYRKALGQPSRT